MGEDLKHIDELFKQGLGDAQIAPPDGLFEQCLEQLDATQSVGTGNGVGTSGSGWATSSWAWLGAAVVVGVSVIAALNLKEEGSQAPLQKESVAENQTLVDRDAKSRTAVEPQAGAVNETDKSAEANGFERNHPVGDGIKINRLSENEAEKASASPGEHSGAITKETDNEKSVFVPKNNRPATVEQKLKPCAGLLGQWRPVIAENVGGSVSLDLMGALHDVRVYWGDGEVSDLNGRGETGGTRLNHNYFVSQRKNFTLKLVNKHRESATGLLCADSQRLGISVTPVNEVSEVFVPDVFTPNGDGANDFFFVEMPKPLQFDITILDAKQRTVFRSNDYLSRWTGMCSESECKEDTYRVILAYKYSGDVEWKYIRKQIKLIR